MNHTKWVGWGVVNVEALDKQQRRVYLKKIRAELAERGMQLHPGGSTQVPWYRITRVGNGPETAKVEETIAGEDALKKICAWALIELGEVQGEHDGVERVAGVDGR